MIRAGIIGGAGYTAGELIRLLINHPQAEISWIHSTSNAGNPVTDVHGGLFGETELRFSDKHPLEEVDVVFLCSGHGKSTEFWSENQLPEGVKVIDLAQDFRDESCGYVYGLPEVNRERIRHASKLANPGCFATAIQLALIPLAAAGLLHGDVAVTGITGSTGAGVKPGATTHFSWRNDNLSVYKPFSHQHLKEIGMTLANLEPGCDADLSFIPVRGDFPRGIFVTATVKLPDMSDDEVRALYNDFYADAAFTFVHPGAVDLKQVVNTNKALIQVVKQGDKLLIVSVIDNLLKGASGQAVQNMNLMFGLDERAGLALKPSAF